MRVMCDVSARYWKACAPDGSITSAVARRARCGSRAVQATPLWRPSAACMRALHGLAVETLWSGCRCRVESRLAGCSSGCCGNRQRQTIKRTNERRGVAAAEGDGEVINGHHVVSARPAGASRRRGGLQATSDES